MQTLNQTSGINNSLSIYQNQGSSTYAYPMSESTWGPEAQTSNRTINKSTNRSQNKVQGRIILSNQYPSYKKQHQSNKSNSFPFYQYNNSSHSLDGGLQLEVSMVELENMLYSLQRQVEECNKIQEQAKFYHNSYSQFRGNIMSEIEKAKDNRTKQNVYDCNKISKGIKYKTSKILAKVESYLNQALSPNE